MTRPSPARRSALRRLTAAGAALCLAAPAAVRADNGAAGVEVETLKLRREDGAVIMDFALRLQLPAAVEDALRRGLPLYFIAQVSLFRPRWYWLDARVARVERQWRLSYAPLTGSYRVSLGTIGQNYATLDEALSAVSRLARWQVAEPGRAEAGERYYGEFFWRLDVNQLPRPLQFGLGSGTEWSFGVERSLRLEG